ncbi:MAG TPA: Spy/CpxP family protein refolding chaperone [Smithella sp.]|jgi:Spy/CpxP family protein refolding chaperone|nr:Spy/CpxP family protein refolding chaperone [Smithella sp.]HNQ65790.1 Spy/CpxP family protein refolding chaperone [Smithella sp.]HOG09730.1 Spy/CpxP family protein refolding chaperone [Smithella sp.]HOO35838.1 Spy/CpxP family protein refolding chaperone [Smithella sp.]HPK21946.1 Spy/CpxP family protein refolding chaperone [Smithella sp.]
MKKITFTMIAVFLGLLLTSQAFAWGPGPGKKSGYCRGVVLEELNVTEDQKTKLDALQLQHFKAVHPLREKIRDKSAALRKLWLQVDPDKNKIMAKQKEVRVLRDQLEDNKTAYRFEVNKILTPKQKEKLAKCGWNKKSGFGPRGGKRGEQWNGHGNCLYLP